MVVKRNWHRGHRGAGWACLLASVWLSVLLTATATHAAGEQELIAVLDLRGVQASEGETAALTDRLRETLLKSGRYTLVDRSQMDAVLSEQALQQAGCTEQECAVQVGQMLGVRKIMAGKVIKVSDQIWMVSAIMVDVETARTEKAESLRHQGDFFTLMDVTIAALAGKLTGEAAPVPATPRPPTAEVAVPGQVWRDPVTGMEFVAIPGGTYEQGCGPWTSDCDDDESPTRRVTLSPFWLGKTEVTQAQWVEVMHDNPAKYQGDNLPVEQVSWDDVQEFVRRLNGRSQGVTFRLPTEAEWEYACRAGGKPVKFGTASGTLNRREANWGRVECCGGDASDGFEATAPVGSFPPNALGLHDMTGNVWEWTLDFHAEDAYRSGPVTDPVGDRSGAFHVSRGGGWHRSPRYVRCSNRGRYVPSVRYVNLGFRLARAR